MKKEEYIKPEMQVIQLKSNTPLLTASLGIDDSDENKVDDPNSIL